MQKNFVLRLAKVLNLNQWVLIDCLIFSGTAKWHRSIQDTRFSGGSFAKSQIMGALARVPGIYSDSAEKSSQEIYRQIQWRKFN